MTDSAIPAHKLKSVFGKDVRLIRQTRDGPGIEARQAAECIVIQEAAVGAKTAGHTRRINRFLNTGGRRRSVREFGSLYRVSPNTVSRARSAWRIAVPLFELFRRSVVNLKDDGIPPPGWLPLAHIVQEGTLPRARRHVAACKKAHCRIPKYPPGFVSVLSQSCVNISSFWRSGGRVYIFPFRARIRKWARNLLLGMKMEKISAPAHRLKAKFTDMICPFARSMKSACGLRKDLQKTIFCGD